MKIVRRLSSCAVLSLSLSIASCAQMPGGSRSVEDNDALRETLGAAVGQRWVLPPTAQTGLHGVSCVAKIHLNERAEVIAVEIIETCGHPEVDASLRTAIADASPLPWPDSRGAVRESVILRFRRSYEPTTRDRPLEEIQAAFESAMPQIRREFLDHRIRRKGVMRVALRILPSGEVVDTGITASDFGDADLASSIAGIVQGFRFKAADVDTMYYSNYPITFIP